MGRLSPEELWRRHTIERFIAFKQSGELKRLHRKGLATCGRKKGFTGNEWFESFHKRYPSPEYQAWHNECEAVAEKFGLAPGTVVCACLVAGYDPEKELSVIEGQWPQLRVITEQTNSLFLQWLSYEAQRLGLYVVQRQGSVETTLLNLNSPPDSALPPSEKPPRDSAFYLRVEIPLGYPPEAARKLQEKADQLAKELSRRLGYPTPQRLRDSPLVAMADKLKVAKHPLASGEAYNIIDDIYGENLTDDQKKRKLVASRRHRLRKRLIEPYQTDTRS